MQKKQVAIDIALIVLSSVVRAFTIHIFILGNNFAPGGVTGIATMLEYATGLSSGYFVFIFNVPLLIVAVIYLGKGFAAKSAVSIVLSSVILIILNSTGRYQFVPQEKIFAALAGGAFMGFSLALMFRTGGSSGGSDIVACIIQKRNQATNVAWFIFMLDASVIVASFFVYNFRLEPVILAIAELFVASKVTETFTQGTKSAVKFEVITDSPDELIAELLAKVKCGVTKVDATGAYTGSKKAMLFCIVHKRDVTDFRTVLKQFGGTTFSYIQSASEVIGKGFSS